PPSLPPARPAGGRSVADPPALSWPLARPRASLGPGRGSPPDPPPTAAPETIAASTRTPPPVVADDATPPPIAAPAPGRPADSPARKPGTAGPLALPRKPPALAAVASAAATPPAHVRLLPQRPDSLPAPPAQRQPGSAQRPNGPARRRWTGAGTRAPRSPPLPGHSNTSAPILRRRNEPSCVGHNAHRRAGRLAAPPLVAATPASHPGCG